MKKRPEDMTDAELRMACGIPLGCPDEVLIAMLRGDANRATHKGLEAVQAAAREQANWSPERKEEVRLLSLRPAADAGGYFFPGMITSPSKFVPPM